jgi:hypothetical protein
MIAKHNISQQFAEEMIEKVCQENNWFFGIPVSIQTRWRIWKIVANSNCNDNNAWIYVDKKTHEIVDRGFSINMTNEKAKQIVRDICKQNNWIFAEICFVDAWSSTEWVIGFREIVKIGGYSHVTSRCRKWISVSKKTGEVIRVIGNNLLER